MNNDPGAAKARIGAAVRGRDFEISPDECREEKSMLRRCLLLGGGVVFLMCCCGCEASLYGQKETMLEKNWGRSFQAAKENQILNPDAEKNLAPVAEMDGPAAQKTIETYRGKFERESPTAATPPQNVTFGGGLLR